MSTLLVGEPFAVEAAWQNAFEICSYISTIVMSRPDQFKWPTLLSVLAVVAAGLLYALFFYLRRGHLLHLSNISPCRRSRTRQKRTREDGLERIISDNDV
jgi:iron-regulated transporter 1